MQQKHGTVGYRRRDSRLKHTAIYLETEGMLRQHSAEIGTEGRLGCGPLIPPLSDTLRPLRQQVFERVRSAGLISRVQVSKDLGVSPASVTTLTSELIEAGLIEEVAAPREAEQGRGRPAVLLGVRAQAHRVAGMKLSDREHTAVIVDFAGICPGQLTNIGTWMPPSNSVIFQPR